MNPTITTSGPADVETAENPHRQLLHRVSFGGYRTFDDAQSVHLAPVTLLVGHTYKTSLLAMIHSVYNAAMTRRGLAAFGTAPYLLGDHDALAANGATFCGGLEFARTDRQNSNVAYVADAVFGGDDGNRTALKERRLSTGDYWVKEGIADDHRGTVVAVGTPAGTWEYAGPPPSDETDCRGYRAPEPMEFLWSLPERIFWEGETATAFGEGGVPAFKPTGNTVRAITPADLADLCDRLSPPAAGRGWIEAGRRHLYSSVPVRAELHPIYDLRPTTPRSDGSHIMGYLGQLATSQPDEWGELRERLAAYGTEAGLFTDIAVETERCGAPGRYVADVRFLVAGRVRQQNLATMGGGLRQILPLIVEICRQDGPPIILMQHPETGLHPQAQDAFGRLLCEAVKDDRGKRQFVVETHSDWLLSAIQMGPRDGHLDPEDATIVYLERQNRKVAAHTIGYDEMGNIRGAPDTYRRWHMEQTTRFLGL